MGLDGLLETAGTKTLPAGVVTQDPTLDEIVVYHTGPEVGK